MQGQGAKYILQKFLKRQMRPKMPHKALCGAREKVWCRVSHGIQKKKAEEPEDASQGPSGAAREGGSGRTEGSWEGQALESDVTRSHEPRRGVGLRLHAKSCPGPGGAP